MATSSRRPSVLKASYGPAASGRTSLRQTSPVKIWESHLAQVVWIEAKSRAFHPAAYRQNVEHNLHMQQRTEAHLALACGSAVPEVNGCQTAPAGTACRGMCEPVAAGFRPWL